MSARTKSRDSSHWSPAVSHDCITPKLCRRASKISEDNVFDKRTLYGAVEPIPENNPHGNRHTSTSRAAFLPELGNHGHSALDQDATRKLESQYIQMFRPRSKGRKALKRQILKYFLLPPKSDTIQGPLQYRIPKVNTIPATAEILDNYSFSLPPPKIFIMSALSCLPRPSACTRNGGSPSQFCEVLGPASCSSCIESTNKKLALALQQRLFPQVEVTQRHLVAPDLGRILHVTKPRRNRDGTHTRKSGIMSPNKIQFPSSNALSEITYKSVIPVQ